MSRVRECAAVRGQCATAHWGSECASARRPIGRALHTSPPMAEEPGRSSPAHWTSFTTWLRHQRHRTVPVGSLAADMAGDGGWPELGTLPEYHAYLNRYAAPWFVHQALDDAWTEYEHLEVTP